MLLQRQRRVSLIVIFAISQDVWGFDKNAVDVLQKMKPVDEYLNHKYAILLENGEYTPETETDVSIISGTNVSCVSSSVKNQKHTRYV